MWEFITSLPTWLYWIAGLFGIWISMLPVLLIKDEYDRSRNWHHQTVDSLKKTVAQLEDERRELNRDLAS